MYRACFDAHPTTPTPCASPAVASLRRGQVKEAAALARNGRNRRTGTAGKGDDGDDTD